MSSVLILVRKTKLFKIYSNVHQYPVFLSQLLRQTSLLTLPAESEARFLLTILSDTENSLSRGTVVAGGQRYL